jgi:colanic acid biosynthesis glycosyl transferase WcaI
LLPRRDVRDAIPVLRLPLWAGRGTTAQRLRQELTYTAALSSAAPMLSRPDVIVAVSPSFPALAPTMVTARLRRVPWVLWLQDILPDGATATGLLDDGALVRAARRFELTAYRSARRIVVISDSFAGNLHAKGVAPERIERIFNPATRPIQNRSVGERRIDERLVLTMGNVGRSQNLVHVTRAFESSRELAEAGARFVIVGDGVAGNDVRATIATDRVELTGVVDSARLEAYLQSASVALVSQQYDGLDFNVPSKLMNFMAYGLPTVAAVRPDSEVAKIIRESGGGWVTDGPDPAELSRQLMAALGDRKERDRRGKLALRFARENFASGAFAARFEGALLRVVPAHPALDARSAPRAYHGATQGRLEPPDGGAESAVDAVMGRDG